MNGWSSADVCNNKATTPCLRSISACVRTQPNYSHHIKVTTIFRAWLGRRQWRAAGRRGVNSIHEQFPTSFTHAGRRIQNEIQPTYNKVACRICWQWSCIVGVYLPASFSREMCEMETRLRMSSARVMANKLSDKWRRSGWQFELLESLMAIAAI